MKGTEMRVQDDPGTDIAGVHVVLRTEERTKAVAYLTAAIPILLATVALLLLVAGVRARRSILRIQEIALAVVLGVFAALPIRQVTVPSDLTGLTRIDMMLAFGLVAAVGVLMLALALQLWLDNDSA
jgi:FtsH-binding integral membrane protein